MEARTDTERRVISEAMQAGLARRPLGNLVVVKRLVHAAWVQIDLRLHGEGGKEVDVKDVYDTVVSGLRMPPSFT